MKYFSSAACLVLLGLSLIGCDRESGAVKTAVIEPGEFVATEPSAIHGSLSTADKCSIDTINGNTRKPKVGWEIKRGDPIDIQGWVFSNDGKQVAPEVFVQLTGSVETYYAVTTNRSIRSDANQHLTINPSLAGGFQLQAKSDAIEPGSYEINVVQALGNRRESCEDGVSLIVN